MPFDTAHQPPHARESAPWCWCGVRTSPDFGTVFATQGLNGSVALWWNRKATDHIMTLGAGEELGAEIVIEGRRFDVVRLWEAAEQKAAA